MIVAIAASWLACGQSDQSLVADERPPVAWVDPLPDPLWAGVQTLTGAVEGRAPLSVRWFVDGGARCDPVSPEADGGTACSVALDPGRHTVALQVVDGAGRVAAGAVAVEVGSPEAPSAQVILPMDGAVVLPGEVDVLGGVSGGGVVSWTSTVDGIVGGSAPDPTGIVSETVVLSVGVHRITLAIDDAAGGGATDTVEIDVRPEVVPPTLVLLEPEVGTRVNAGTALLCTAIVDHPTVNPPDLWVAWASDRDGLLGTPVPTSTGWVTLLPELSAGSHVLTVTVTEPDGGVDQAAIPVTVNGLPSAPVIHLDPPDPGPHDDLVVSVDASAVDPEGDPVTHTFAWSADGVPSTASTSDRLLSGATAAGQVWSVTVTASDPFGTGGSATARVSIH